MLAFARYRMLSASKIEIERHSRDNIENFVIYTLKIYAVGLFSFKS